MDQTELLRLVVRALERLGIPYMIVGSLASSAYGQPRMTQDIDVVIDADEKQAVALCTAFQSDDFYASPEGAAEAARRRTRFNIIHSRSGNKIDVMLRRDTAFARAEMSRRQRVRLLPDLQGYAARPEDVILGKLIYYAEGGSDKHLRDIASMMSVSAGEIDTGYIERWAGLLGLNDVWRMVGKRLNK